MLGLNTYDLRIRMMTSVCNRASRLRLRQCAEVGSRTRIGCFLACDGALYVGTAMAAAHAWVSDVARPVQVAN